MRGNRGVSVGACPNVASVSLTVRLDGEIDVEISPFRKGSAMRYLKLGSTGLEVSPIAIGAMTYGDPRRGHPCGRSTRTPAAR
jgi:hypothetical protein